jgi:hypothetical protein
MNGTARALLLAILTCGAFPFVARAGADAPPEAPPRATFTPTMLSLQPSPPESIYAPPEASPEDLQVNAGGVNFVLSATYWSDYVFRGIDRSETSGSEDSGNSQVEGLMTFDLGKWPDLFLGVFTNINDADPISRFQEIRPYFGLELSARPVIFALGNTFYIYPDRDDFNTSEVWGRLMLDDSYFFRSDDPVLSPYVMLAWDYDKSDGFYIEFGVRHDFAFEDLPLTLSPVARVAYVGHKKTFLTGGMPGLAPP